MQTPFEIIRIKLSSLVKKRPESTFISKPPLLRKVKAYDDSLDFNSQAIHIFKQIKNL
jgi:hypothetical protein